MIRILLFVMLAALLLTHPFQTGRGADAAPESDTSATQKPGASNGVAPRAHGGGSHVPARETRNRSSGGVPGGRPGLPRWHSFLPGMFR